MIWTTTLALAGLGTAAQESRPVHESRAIAAVERLSEIGYPIDLDQLTLTVKSPDGVREDIDRQQDLFFRPSYFDGMHLFYSGLGIDAGADGDELRKSGVEAMANVFRAYYQADRKSLVFLQTEKNELWDSLTGIEPIVVHELVHAHQDQSRGLEDKIRANRGSMERVRIFQCLMEGEAELVALSQGIRETGRTLDDLSVDDLDSDLERILTGEALTLVYSAGRRFMLERFHEGGWAAVRASFESGPPSTEQLLHLEKLGKDAPREVTLPELDLELVHEDVMGELEIYKILLLVQSSRNVAHDGAVGWDGDLMRAYTGEDGAFAVVWRTVWDREVDSHQFMDALGTHVGGTTVRRGRAVDWVNASTDELTAEVLTRLETHAADDREVLEDVASAALIEKRWQRKLEAGPRVEQDRWVFDRVGLSIPIAEGWKVDEINGVAMLIGPGNFPGQTNLNVQIIPTLGVEDLDLLQEQNEVGMAQFDGIEVDYIDQRAVGGENALVYEFHGTLPGNPIEMHFMGAILLREGKQIVVTATTVADRWEEIGDAIAAIFAGVELF